MHPQIVDAFARLPDYLGGHVAVSLTALALGLGLNTHDGHVTYAPVAEAHGLASVGLDTVLA